MTARELVAEQALSLTPEDRVYLLGRLEQSLIPEEVLADSQVIEGEALAGELQRRTDAYHSGATTSQDAFEFMAELRRQRHPALHSRNRRGQQSTVSQKPLLTEATSAP